jgi:hypothetical protein
MNVLPAHFPAAMKVSQRVSFATLPGARRIGPSSVAEVCLKTGGKIWLLARRVGALGVAKLGLENKAGVVHSFPFQPQTTATAARGGCWKRV